MNAEKIGAGAIFALGLGTVLAFVLPLGVVLLWIRWKKEKLTTVLAGAATFLLFALILEKPIQNVLLFPTQMGLADHAVSRFVGARPVLWSVLVGLFPGVFEETGRLVAFKTLLKKRKNRETAISHGIGHGCFEVWMILGAAYASNMVCAVMINTGVFQTVIEQTAAKAPEQAAALYALGDQLAAVTAASIGVGLAERVFAVLFHIGASILVFYACRGKGRAWLYPLAILLHTAMDTVAGLAMAGLFRLSTLGLELIVGAFGLLTFCGPYFLLYRKDAGAAD